MLSKIERIKAVLLACIPLSHTGMVRVSYSEVTPLPSKTFGDSCLTMYMEAVGIQELSLGQGWKHPTHNEIMGEKDMAQQLVVLFGIFTDFSLLCSQN